MKKSLLAIALAGISASAMAQDFKWQAFYTQTYENVAAVADVWKSQNNQGAFSIATSEDGGHYVNYENGNTSGDRGYCNLDVVDASLYEGITEYRMEFDLSLSQSRETNHVSFFAVGTHDLQTNGKDYVTTSGGFSENGLNYGLGGGALLNIVQKGASGTTWQLYSQGALGSNEYIGEFDEYTVTLNADEFYHFTLTVSPSDKDWTADVKVEITNMAGEPVIIYYANEEVEEVANESIVLPYTDKNEKGYFFNRFLGMAGRQYSKMKIDNIMVEKKVDANAVAVPSVAMTGVMMEKRIVAIDNSAAGEGVTAYYAVVDEATYTAATSAEGLNGTAYTKPFTVGDEMNYVLAWNVDASGKASELAKLTVEAGVAIQLNAPTISASDFVGYKKTYVASCDQSNIKPFAPQAYTIYMSADGENWTETSTFTVESGKVYAKVEADGYTTATAEPVEAPEGAYGSTKWSVADLVITKNDGILNEEEGTTIYDFSASSKGRTMVGVEYWGEDVDNYDADHAIPFLKKNGLHFIANGTTNALFLLGSGNADGYTINGVCVYNYRESYITIDNLHEGDLVQVIYNNGTSSVLTVDDPETFKIALPSYNVGSAIATISIKGAGTVDTYKTKASEWGIFTPSRTVADVEKAGATFYKHAYTIYNDETQAADTLLLTPVKDLVAGTAYIYEATADEMEIVTLEAEEPVDEQVGEQIEFDSETFIATFEEEQADKDAYTLVGKTLMKGASTEIPANSGYFINLDGQYGSIYDAAIDYKLQAEYTKFVSDYEKALSDYENADPEYDEEGNPIEKPALDPTALWNEKFDALVANYAVITVAHKYDAEVVGIATAKKDNNGTVNVVTPTGVVIRRNVNANDALNGLARGLYIVGNKKIMK